MTTECKNKIDKILTAIGGEAPEWWWENNMIVEGYTYTCIIVGSSEIEFTILQRISDIVGAGNVTVCTDNGRLALLIFKI